MDFRTLRKNSGKTESESVERSAMGSPDSNSIPRNQGGDGSASGISPLANSKASPVREQAKPPHDGMTLRKAAELFNFETPGTFLFGRLLRIDRVTINGKPGVAQYTIVNRDGVFKFLGTYDLDSKIRNSDQSRTMQITYVGDDRSVQKNGNCMKLFEIWIDERDGKSAPSGAQKGDPDFEITDEDISF